MDVTPIIALALALGCILGGNAMEGGHLSALIQPTAAMIVLGGTLAATWLSATPAEVKKLFKLSKRVIFPGLALRALIVEDLLKVSGVVRRDGMLAVEPLLAELRDPTLRRGLQLLVDGNAAEDVQALLELEADMEEHHSKSAAKILDSAGGFAPTVGILGAVMGLIHVMSNLNDPTKLGSGIAVAFVATLYGVGFANLVFLPIGARIRKIVEAEAEDRAMVLAGLIAVVAGANGRQISERLGPYTGHGGGHAEPGAGGGGAKEAA
jgi:chemotaxis protein MotA